MTAYVSPKRKAPPGGVNRAGFAGGSNS
jgi:hypothetical protein